MVYPFKNPRKTKRKKHKTKDQGRGNDSFKNNEEGIKGTKGTKGIRGRYKQKRILIPSKTIVLKTTKRG